MRLNHFLNKSLLIRVSLMVCTGLLIALPAFAAKDPGVEANSWIVRNIGALIPGVIIIGAVIFLVTRDWMKALSFFGLVLLVAVISDWEAMKGFAKSLWTTIFG
ncbi:MULTISPECIES: hypothetical protein [Paenibacillus]|uniref:Uncharacterized protein n=1 Tax=Paenibacillus illinoisensis TaxID=59845 RepID=A0A2W0CTV9_9BACL|nr:hypothetical protein [Paenibacillus illinoisensis]PYY30988.1 Uncharacterized protein PIL02S_00535 [Paenibacillus illinoisensis]